MTTALVLLIIAIAAYFFLRSSKQSHQRAREEATEDSEWISYSDPRTEALPPFQALTASLKINYQDFRGKRSEREVDVRAFAPGPPAYVAGICKLRGGYRTFKIDRISYAVDTTTGEEIANLTEFLQAKYDSAPERAWERLLADDMPALRLLLYVAKADGQFTTKERDVVVDFCQTMSQRSDITRQQLNTIARDLPVTSIASYRRLCGEIASLPAQKRDRVVKAAHDIVATQRTVSTEEKDALDYLNKRLAKANPNA